MNGLERVTASLALLAASALAGVPMATLAAAEDPVEVRLRTLGEELRCLVCQNQTLADSQSGLADDLRREIRAQIVAGHSDDEIVRYLVDRYGDFVRYRPPVKATTLLLWGGPLLALCAGMAALVAVIRRRGKPQADAALDDGEQAELARLLAAPAKGESR